MGMGGADFFAILQTYYDRNRYGIATPASLPRAMEDVTGEPQRELYERWIGPLQGPPG